MNKTQIFLRLQVFRRRRGVNKSLQLRVMRQITKRTKGKPLILPREVAEVTF